MVHVLSGRAETGTQSRILSYVRDEGPLSRMDLATRLNVSRTTVAAEVGRLVELGLAEDGGPPASRDNANRDEFTFIGGAGSCNAMRWITDGEMAATVIYPPTQAADGIRLARLIAQNKGMSDLVQVEVRIGSC